MSNPIDPRTVFTPDRPLVDPQLLAGRLDELKRLIALLTAPGGTQVALVGERGVGKTSLVKIASHVSSGHVSFVVRVNCTADSDFPSLWRHALDQMKFKESKPGLGFNPENHGRIASLAEKVGPSPEPGDVLNLLAMVRAPSIFVFDEFDRLGGSGAVTRKFADLIKGLTDENVPVSLVLVGVADNVTDLFDMHGSVERSLKTIPLPRMSDAEIAEIPTRGAKRLSLNFSDEAVNLITYLARGFPHIAHLMSLHAVEHVRSKGVAEVEMGHVALALTTAMSESDPALRDRYQEATESPRKDAQFRHVLAACSLVPKDLKGYFRPSGLKEPFSEVVGKAVQVSSFTQKLNDFCDGRCYLLTRRGKARHYQYRFTNPMMESYVRIRSLMDGLITREQLRRAWSPS